MGLPGRVSEEVADDVVVALNEVATNAVRCGSRGGQPVEVVVHVNDDWVAVEALPAMTGQAALTAADRREATPRPGNAAQAALVRFLTP